MIRKIRSFFKNLKYDVNNLAKDQQSFKSNLAEGTSFSQLQSLLHDLPYLPFTKASLNHSSLAVFLNDIVINNRRNILEFGSGNSTIVIAALLKKNKIPQSKIYSVESDINWIEIIRRLIESYHLSDYVELIYAPLVNCDFSLDKNLWFDTGILKKKLENLLIDSVLVDGPPAWYAEVYRSRYPALPFVYPILNKKFSIFLDDTNRNGEKEILELWQRDYQIERIQFSENFTGLFSGRDFDIRLP